VNSFEWAITEPVDVTETSEGVYRVQQVEGPGAVLEISSTKDENSYLLFNGEFVDVQDDFISYVSLIDDYYEQGGEIGKTIRMKPYQDDPECGFEEV